MSAEHFTFFSYLTPDPNWQKFTLALIVGSGLVYTAARLTSQIKSEQQVDAAIIPQQKLSSFGFFDFFVEAFVKFHDSVLGRENRRFISFTGTIFLFLLVSNLLGLIPGMPALTTTVWVNVGIALVVFLYFNYQGIKSHGVVGYFKHFCGPVWWLMPLFLALEVLSTCLRVFTLNLRLFWNISADHLVLGIFTDLIPIGVPVIFYGLGTFVSFMQAFVFSMLTMVYLLIATQHSDSH